MDLIFAPTVLWESVATYQWLEKLTLNNLKFARIWTACSRLFSGVFKKLLQKLPFYSLFCCVFGSFGTFLAIWRVWWQIPKKVCVSHYKRHQWPILSKHLYQLRIWLQKFIESGHFWTKNENPMTQQFFAVNDKPWEWLALTNVLQHKSESQKRRDITLTV